MEEGSLAHGLWVRDQGPEGAGLSGAARSLAGAASTRFMSAGSTFPQC